MMVKFRHVDPSIAKKAKQNKPLKEIQTSKAPLALMSIFNINSDETISQTPSPGPSRGTILDFQPRSLAPGGSVRIQHISSKGTTEAGGTESRDKDAYKRPDNESHYFLEPGVSHDHDEKWYTSNENSDKAGDRQDEVMERVDCLYSSSTKSHSSTIIHPSTTSPATLNGIVPSIFSANFLSRDDLETLRFGESLENASQEHHVSQKQSAEQNDHNTDDIMSELAETNVCGMDYKIDRLDDSDNNATCHCDHHDEARAKELQTAQKDDIVTQEICSSPDMEIHNPFSGHQSEQIEASTTEDASKKQMQDGRKDQKFLKRSSYDEVMDPQNSPKEKRRKLSEELCMDNARIPNSKDGESAIWHNANLVPLNIQDGTLACIPTSGQRFAPLSLTDGITKRRPTRSCVPNKEKSTLQRHFQVTKRTSVKKRTPMVKFTRDEYERIRRWRDDDKIPWPEIFLRCADEFPEWQQTSIKQRYFATRYMKHPVESILAKKLGRYLIVWAEDNSMSWEPKKYIPSLLIKEFEKNYQGFNEGVGVQASQITENGSIEYFLSWSYRDKKMEGDWEKKGDMSPNLLNRIRELGFETQEL